MSRTKQAQPRSQRDGYTCTNFADVIDYTQSAEKSPIALYELHLLYLSDAEAVCDLGDGLEDGVDLGAAEAHPVRVERPVGAAQHHEAGGRLVHIDEIAVRPDVSAVNNFRCNDDGSQRLNNSQTNAC